MSRGRGERFIGPSPKMAHYPSHTIKSQRCDFSSDANRWDENAGLRRDAIRSQVIDALEAQEIKETGNEDD